MRRRVVSAGPHPHADLIRIAFVDLGEGPPRQIVYGGTRVLFPGDDEVHVFPSHFRPGQLIEEVLALVRPDR
jgi:hypothetical protein